MPDAIIDPFGTDNPSWFIPLTDEEKQHKIERKAVADAYAANGDTYYNNPYIDTVNILCDLGFVEVFERTYIGSYDYDKGAYTKETQKIFWNPDGILASVNSYQGNSNVGTIWYNWVPNDQSLSHEFVSSGGYREYEGGYVWVGSFYTTEGLREHFTGLIENGTFLPEWVESPYVSFLNSDEHKHSNTEQVEQNKALISQLPEHVQYAIGVIPND